MYLIISFIYVIGFTLIHYFSKYMHFSIEVFHNKLVSFFAGISVSYVFVYLLPKLNYYQQIVLASLKNSIWLYIENHIYMIALLGLILFYSLERLVTTSRKDVHLKEPEQIKTSIFWA